MLGEKIWEYKYSLGKNWWLYSTNDKYNQEENFTFIKLIKTKNDILVAKIKLKKGTKTYWLKDINLQNFFIWLDYLAKPLGKLSAAYSATEVSLLAHGRSVLIVFVYPK